MARAISKLLQSGEVEQYSLDKYLEFMAANKVTCLSDTRTPSLSHTQSLSHTSTPQISQL